MTRGRSLEPRSVKAAWPALCLLWVSSTAPFARADPAGKALVPTLPSSPRDQLGLVRGRVFERGTRRPIRGATVEVDGKNSGETDPEGEFQIELLPGPHRLNIRSIEHQPLSRRLWVPSGRLLEQRFGLDALETVEVEVRGQPRDAPAIGRSGAEARRTPGALGDPWRVIESLPGVVPILWPASVYAVRGSNPGATGYYIDGLRVPALFHFALGPSVVHPYLIEGIDFYPGVYPARFGGYTAGIVTARTAPPPADRPHASVDVRLYDAGGLVSAPFDGRRGTAMVAGRYSYTGPLLELFTDNKLSYADYQLRLDHPLLGGRGVVFALGSFDELGSVKYPDQSAVQQFHRLDLRWQVALGGGRLQSSLAFGLDRTRSLLFDVPFLARSCSVAPRLGYTTPLSDWASFELGVDALVQDFDPEPDPFQGRLSDLAQPRTAWSNGGYLALTLQPTPRLLIVPAFRYDEFLEGGALAVEPEPRLHLRARVAGEVWLKAAVGRFAQMPSLPLGVAGMEAFGLAQFGPQTSLGGSLGVEMPVVAGVRLDSALFGSQMRVTDIRSTEQLTNVLRDNYFELRNARSYGVEVMLERPSTYPLSGWIAYTLSYSQREVDYVYGPSDWDQRHVLNLVVNQKLGRGWLAGGRVHYHTGRIQTVTDWYGGTGAERVRLPPFYQLDLRLEKKWTLDDYFLTAYAEFANLTMTREVYGYTRRFADGSERREQSFKIVLPSLGVRAEL
jgi:hypothetical protein